MSTCLTKIHCFYFRHNVASMSFSPSSPKSCNRNDKQCLTYTSNLRQSLYVCNAAHKDVHVGVSNTESFDLPVKPDFIAPLALGAALAASFLTIREIIKSRRMNRGFNLGQMNFDAALEGTNLDGREYRMALARTRQAVSVQRAVGFLNAGNIARSMVELRRALHENSICRAPLINTSHSQTELQQLYKMHLRNSTVPSDFATLLQLRTLLHLDFEEAEKIERDIMEQSSAYNI